MSLVAVGHSLTLIYGVLVAAFGGAHGWFWRNRTDETVTVTLRTSGAYNDIRLPE